MEEKRPELEQPTTSHELVKPEPATANANKMSPEEQTAIDDAIEYINSLHAKATIDLARRLGRYILDTFYDGDVDAYQSPQVKHSSLRKLGADPRLKVTGGYTFLSRCVGVAILFPSLPEGVRESLGWSEYTELLPVRDDKLRLRLARRVAKKHVPIRQLRQEVRKAREKAGELPRKRGRPPVPTARGLAKAAKDLSDRVGRAPVGKPGEERDEMESALADLEAGIQSVLGQIDQLKWGEGVATSQHRVVLAADDATGPDATPVAAKTRPGTQLREQVYSLIQEAENLGDIDRWRFLRDAGSVFRHEYERCPRPEPSELMKGFEPAPMVGKYAGSKQSLVQPIIENLVRFNPHSGPYSRVLCEPFSGLAAVSRYALQIGVVDQVRLNDADPAIAAYLTAIINSPDSLIKRIWVEQDIRLGQIGANLRPDYEREEVRSPPDLTHLQYLWNVVGEARNYAVRGKETDREQDNTPIHHNKDLAYAAAVLLNCAPGYGLTRDPNEIWADNQWNPTSLCDRINEWHRILRGRVVGNECSCRSAFDVLKEPGWGLAFIDPPYNETEDMYGIKWGDEEHRRLSRLLAKLKRHWLLTYGAKDLIRSLYPEGEFVVSEVDVNRALQLGGEPELELWISKSGWAQDSLWVDPVR